MRLGIALLSGSLRRVDFAATRDRFARVPTRMGELLRDLLSSAEHGLILLASFRQSPNVFAFLRNGGLLVARVMTRRLCGLGQRRPRPQCLARHRARGDGLARAVPRAPGVRPPVVRVRRGDRPSHAHGPLLGPLALPRSECRPPAPDAVLGHFVREFHGLFCDACLLQAAVESRASPLPARCVVYRGVAGGGADARTLQLRDRRGCRLAVVHKRVPRPRTCHPRVRRHRRRPVRDHARAGRRRIGDWAVRGPREYGGGSDRSSVGVRPTASARSASARNSSCPESC
jgi:hypothetical protein